MDKKDLVVACKKNLYKKFITDKNEVNDRRCNIPQYYIVKNNMQDFY